MSVSFLYLVQYWNLPMMFYCELDVLMSIVLRMLLEFPIIEIE